MSNDLHKPTIPPIVRTVIYALGLIVGTLAVLVTGVAAIWFPDNAVEILATVGAVTAASSWLAGATGVAYRPTGFETPRRAVDNGDASAQVTEA